MFYPLHDCLSVLGSCLDHVEGEVVVLAPHGQVSDLHPLGCLVVVVDRSYHCCVICKCNDGVGVVPCRAVMSEQGVQEGAEHPLPSVVPCGRRPSSCKSRQ